MTRTTERGKIPRTEWAEVRRRAEEYLRQTSGNGSAKKRPEEMPPERPPMVFGYRRISPGDSKHGLDAQVPAVEAYFTLLKIDEPDLPWGEWFADNHESAFKKQFLERPEGRRLHTTVRRGDHIIFAKFDRAFRQARDAHNMLAMWQERGIHVHFADLRVDTNTAHGRLFLSLLAAMAQWESEVTSERCKATVQYLKSKGRVYNQAPIGMKNVGKQGKKKAVWDKPVRRVMKVIVKLHDQHGWSFLRISDWLEERQAAKDDRRPYPMSGPRAWKVDRCRKAYRVEKRYQAEEQGQRPPTDNGNGQG